MREPPGPCGAGRLRCVCWAWLLCVPVGGGLPPAWPCRRPDRFPAAAWPVLLGRAAVCAGGRRPAREIATREPGGSEWSISKPGQAQPPPTGTAARPCRPRGGLPSVGACCLCPTCPGPAATHRHRDQAPHPAITHTIPAPTPNFACNSPTTVSNLESTTLELQRFQTLLKLHPIELHATFLGECPGSIHRHRSQALGNLAASSTGIPRGYPQALFGAGGYPQGFVSAWITRRHARSVFVDGPTRGPTKE